MRPVLPSLALFEVALFLLQKARVFDVFVKRTAPFWAVFRIESSKTLEKRVFRRQKSATSKRASVGVLDRPLQSPRLRVGIAQSFCLRIRCRAHQERLALDYLEY